VLVAAPRRVPPARSEPPAIRFRSFGSGQQPDKFEITRAACLILSGVSGSVLGERSSGPVPLMTSRRLGQAIHCNMVQPKRQTPWMMKG
jgi:hypothetical protein